MGNAGYKLIANSNNEKSFAKKIGTMLVLALPKVIKGLSVIGTIALILVAGGIFVHNVDFVHHLLPALPSVVLEFVVGLVVGFIGLLLVKILHKIWKMIRKK